MTLTFEEQMESVLATVSQIEAINEGKIELLKLKLETLEMAHKVEIEKMKYQYLSAKIGGQYEG